MKKFISTIPALALATACVVNDDVSSNDESTGSETSNTNTSPPTTTAPTSTSNTSADSSGSDSSATDPDSSGTQAESSSTTVDPTIFEFNDTPIDQYTRVDRKGFPAVNTGTHIDGDKDAYNQGSPVDDAALEFVAEAFDSIQFLHWGGDSAPNPAGPGLDDEISGLGLTPCGAPDDGFFGSCVTQGGGAAVIPDVLKIDTDLTAGFHFDVAGGTCGPIANGRGLPDPVIDIILAVLLLDLSEPLPDAWGGVPCPGKDDPPAPASAFLSIAALGGGSLNPAANDLAFEAEFPYLAAAHE